jgi:hypothetical protein
LTEGQESRFLFPVSTVENGGFQVLDGFPFNDETPAGLETDPTVSDGKDLDCDLVGGEKRNKVAFSIVEDH